MMKHVLQHWCGGRHAFASILSGVEGELPYEGALAKGPFSSHCIFKGTRQILACLEASLCFGLHCREARTRLKGSPVLRRLRVQCVLPLQTTLVCQPLPQG